MPHTVDLDVELSRIRMDWAAMQMKVALFKLRYLSGKAYNPAQPRDDIGRWAGGGSIGGQSDGTQVAQRGPSGPRTPGPLTRRIGGRDVTISLSQQIRMGTAIARSDSAIRQVREIEPNYRPSASIYEGVEGEIAAREGEAREAEARSMQLSRERMVESLRDRGSNATIEDMLLPGGREIGVKLPGVDNGIPNFNVPRIQTTGKLDRIESSTITE